MSSIVSAELRHLLILELSVSLSFLKCVIAISFPAHPALACIRFDGTRSHSHPIASQISKAHRCDTQDEMQFSVE